MVLHLICTPVEVQERPLLQLCSNLPLAAGSQPSLLLLGGDLQARILADLQPAEALSLALTCKALKGAFDKDVASIRTLSALAILQQLLDFTITHSLPPAAAEDQVPAVTVSFAVSLSRATLSRLPQVLGCDGVSPDLAGVQRVAFFLSQFSAQARPLVTSTMIKEWTDTGCKLLRVSLALGISSGRPEDPLEQSPSSLSASVRTTCIAVFERLPLLLAQVLSAATDHEVLLPTHFSFSGQVLSCLGTAPVPLVRAVAD